MENKKILVVEDDESIRESVKDLLEMEGYTVECASNGEEGIKALRGGNLPGLILLDLMMPRTDGFQFRLEQQQDPALASIPVVILTADGDVEKKQERLCASAYIRKPVDIETIIEVVKRCCL